MNIAIMAHDKKKELMVQFCIAYKGILAKHSLSATNTTGRLVSEATGLPITLYLSRAQGGQQQVGARIAYNEIDSSPIPAATTPFRSRTCSRSSGFAICTTFPLPPTWPQPKC